MLELFEIFVDTESFVDYVRAVSEYDIAVIVLFVMQRIEEIDMLLTFRLNESGLSKSLVDAFLGNLPAG